MSSLITFEQFCLASRSLHEGLEFRRSRTFFKFLQFAIRTMLPIFEVGESILKICVGSIVVGYWLNDLKVWVRFPATFATASGTNLGSNQWAPGMLSPG
jgi:hypothetical protein